MIRLIYISILLSLIGCSEPSNGTDTQITVDGNSLLNTTYCLFDLLEGDPEEGGCWTVVSTPPGSSINALADPNPCIDFDNEPCPSEFVFAYSASCACEDCLPPTELTICLTCDPPQCNVSITTTCN